MENGTMKFGMNNIPSAQPSAPIEYKLTDYTADELTTLSMAMHDIIEARQQKIEIVSKFEDSDMKKEMLTRDRLKLSIYREHHVHLLTALGIVSEKEKALSN